MFSTDPRWNQTIPDYTQCCISCSLSCQSIPIPSKRCQTSVCFSHLLAEASWLVHSWTRWVHRLGIKAGAPRAVTSPTIPIAAEEHNQWRSTFLPDELQWCCKARPEYPFSLDWIWNKRASNQVCSVKMCWPLLGPQSSCIIHLVHGNGASHRCQFTSST